MTFQVKTYRGSTLGEALQEVHKELGEDALILSTRSLDERAFLGLRRKPVVEITAGVRDQPPKPPPSRPLQRNGSTKLIRRLYKRVDPAQTSDNPADASALELEAEIREVRGMVQDLVKQARYRSLAELPEQYLSLYSTLIELELPEPEVRELVQQLAEELPADRLADTDLLAEVESLLQEEFDVTGPLPPQLPGRAEAPARGRVPYAISFFGPSGAGKTSAMAKLAGQLLLQGRSLALISVDPYRMEALEQVQQYGEIFGVPFRGAMTPDELNGTLRELQDVDIALIDTAGRSQRNRSRMEELRLLLDVNTPQERHLVIPATLSLPTMREVLARYGRMAYDRLLITKLDEAVHCGCLVALSQEAGVPFSYLSAGQEVPDDLLPASASLLARLTLASAGRRAGGAS